MSIEKEIYIQYKVLEMNFKMSNYKAAEQNRRRNKDINHWKVTISFLNRILILISL